MTHGEYLRRTGKLRWPAHSVLLHAYYLDQLDGTVASADHQFPVLQKQQAPHSARVQIALARLHFPRVARYLRVAIDHHWQACRLSALRIVAQVQSGRGETRLNTRTRGRVAKKKKENVN